MRPLDDLKKIEKLDKGKTLETVDNLEKQVEEVWEEIRQMAVPFRGKEIKEVLVSGMGGSNLGAHFIKSVFKESLKIPLNMNYGYTLPGSLTKDSLVILSSYSGNTEEVWETYLEARRRKLKVFILAGGGRLGELVKKRKAQGFIFSTTFNFCQQPRMGLGYSTFALLGILDKLNAINIKKAEIKSLVKKFTKLKGQYQAERKQKNNDAKETASLLGSHGLVVVASEFLEGNAHILNNQFNETAKNFSCYHSLPELNHHLLEGLAKPLKNKSYLKFILLESDLYNLRNRERYLVTKRVLKKQGIKYLSFKPKSDGKLAQAWETLVWGYYVSFYLAMLNNLDPTPVPWVDYLKKELDKR